MTALLDVCPWVTLVVYDCGAQPLPNAVTLHDRVEVRDKTGRLAAVPFFWGVFDFCAREVEANDEEASDCYLFLHGHDTAWHQRLPIAALAALCARAIRRDPGLEYVSVNDQLLPDWITPERADWWANEKRSTSMLARVDASWPMLRCLLDEPDSAPPHTIYEVHGGTSSCTAIWPTTPDSSLASARVRSTGMRRSLPPPRATRRFVVAPTRPRRGPRYPHRCGLRARGGLPPLLWGAVGAPVCPGQRGGAASRQAERAGAALRMHVQGDRHRAGARTRDTVRLDAEQHVAATLRRVERRHLANALPTTTSVVLPGVTPTRGGAEAVRTGAPRRVPRGMLVAAGARVGACASAC